MGEYSRESFICYASFYEAASTLKNSDKLRFYETIFRYALFGEEPAKNSGPAYGLFLLVKPQIDANYKRYENGKKGGRKPKPNGNQTETKQKPNGNQAESKHEPNVNVNDNVNANDNANANKNDNANANATGSQSASGWPSLSDVVSYGRATGSRANAAKFWQLNQNRGWKINGEPIRDWRKLFDSWSRSEREPAAGQRSGIDFDAVTPSIGQNVGGSAVDLPEPYRDDDGIEYVDFGGGGT